MHLLSFYGINMVYPAHISNQKFKNHMNLLMITDENKSHFVCIRYFNRSMSNMTKNKNKKHFCRYCSQCFSSAKVLQEDEETCLKINGKQSVKLRSGLIRSQNNFKQLPFHLKFMLVWNQYYNWLKVIIKKIILHILKSIKIIFLALLPIKLFVLI